MKTHDNGCRLIDLAVSNNMVISSTCFPHKNIHKATWVSPDGITANQIDHILIDGRHCSNILDVRSCRGPNIDSDHYLVKIMFRTRIRSKINRLKDVNICRQYVEKLEERILQLWEYNRCQSMILGQAGGGECSSRDHWMENWRYSK